MLSCMSAQIEEATEDLIIRSPYKTVTPTQVEVDYFQYGDLNVDLKKDTLKIFEKYIGENAHDSFKNHSLLLPNGDLINETDCNETSNNLANYGFSSKSRTAYVIPKEWEPKSYTGCTIPKAEYRGISISQLKELWNYIIVSCRKESWTSTNPKHKGKLLHPEEVTLYDLMKYYVFPITKERKCSYVELVSSDPQRQMPDFFCSHWWGDSVLDFISCLGKHAQDHGSLPTYWVCAYSLNQHNMTEELGNDPQSTPFYRAMQLTKGTVSILDFNAACYSRIWCAFEIAKVFELKDKRRKGGKEGYHYDIYALSRQGAPVGLTDGLVEADKWDHQGKGGRNLAKPKKPQWNQSRSKRQAPFPLRTCHKALTLQLEKAQASVIEDRNLILNTIIGGVDNLMSEPPKSHRAYRDLNKRLQGKFAEFIYRTALERDDPQMQQIRRALAAAPYPVLSMSFEGCDEFREEAKKFTKFALPSTLQYLDLEIREIQFERTDEFAVGLSRLSMLKGLKLDAMDCWYLKDLEHLWTEVACLFSLEELQLNFSGCSALSSLRGIESVFPGIKNLSVLTLNLQDCRQLASLNPLFEGLIFARKLWRLHLSCSSENLQGIDGLGRALGQMIALKDISLSLAACNIKALAPLGERLPRAPALDNFRLSLDKNYDLDSVDELGTLLSQMASLHQLELSCFSCSLVPSLADVPKALESMQQLKILRLDFKRCEGLVSIAHLGAAIESLPLVQEICLNFQLCSQLMSGVDELFQALESANLIHLKRLWLDLHGVSHLPPHVAFLSAKRMPSLESLQLRFQECPGVLSVEGLGEWLSSLDGNCFELLELDFRETSVSQNSSMAVFKALVDQNITVSDLYLRFPGYPFIDEFRGLIVELAKKSCFEAIELLSVRLKAPENQQR